MQHFLSSLRRLSNTTKEPVAYGRRVAAAVAAASFDTFRDLLTAQRAVLARFIVLRLNETHAADGAVPQFLAQSRAMLAARGEAAHAAWQFGVALNLARELAGHAAADLGTDFRTRFLGAGLQALSHHERWRLMQRVNAAVSHCADDLRCALFGVAVGLMSMDDAGLLLALPLREARHRLARALDGIDATISHETRRETQRRLEGRSVLHRLTRVPAADCLAALAAMDGVIPLPSPLLSPLSSSLASTRIPGRESLLAAAPR